MGPKALKDAIRQKAGELGFELVGMVPVQSSNTHEIYKAWLEKGYACLLYTSPSPRDEKVSRMPSSA